MAKDYKIFLIHILESIGELEKHIGNLAENDFRKSIIVQDAVIRRLEIIGEAVKNLPISFRSKHTDIQWKQIAGMRDILIHEYFGIDIKLIWKIVKKDIPKLKECVNELTRGNKTLFKN